MKADSYPPADPRRSLRRQPTTAPSPATRGRRGVAVLLVLLMLSIVMGLSYAAVQSQFSEVRVQRNADRHELARQAAITGLTLALKKMHTDQWAGVDTTLSGSLGPYESFQVTFTTGDPDLTPADPDYQELPFRVTLTATGYAADPDNPAAVSTHKAEAVVRLVPRALGTEPNRWSTAVQYTVFQWNYGRFEVNMPCHIEGPMRVQASMDISLGYPWPNAIRWDYLGDLNRMRSSGFPDWRPSDGPIHLSYSSQESAEPGSIAALNVRLGVSTANRAAWPANWTFPGVLAGYRLYPGGKEYFATILPGTLENVTLDPDPETNPLGIYYHNGETNVRDNVTIRGTVLVRGVIGGDIHVEGRNVLFDSVDLPALVGESQPVRLPVAVLEDDFRLEPDSQTTIDGMVLAWDEFEVKADDPDHIELALSGRVAAKEILIRKRNKWGGDKKWWEGRHKDFENQEGAPAGVPFFPEYLRLRDGLDPAPRLEIKPDAAEARYHWQNPNEPLYVPHADDDGLRWELVRWTDSP